MTQKSTPYLAMTLLAFAFIGLELVIFLIESLFYGSMNFAEIAEQRGVTVLLIHWGMTCVAWGGGAWFLCKWAKRRGFNVFENKSKAPALNWIIVLAMLILAVIASYFSWDMRFKPSAEFAGFAKLFGNRAVLAFVGQYVYYVVESILFLCIVVFGQKFGELAFRKHNIPWGGIACGLTWGIFHIATQDLFTGIYCAIISVAFGAVYLLLKRNVRYTYFVIMLMFML
ncbi:MAG: hypothetical protein FWH20_03225 [Oscillospiraceae bacterium]|nr:hypothetical protein [Oscillospiraceae bacterium]